MGTICNRTRAGMRINNNTSCMTATAENVSEYRFGALGTFCLNDATPVLKLQSIDISFCANSAMPPS